MPKSRRGKGKRFQAKKTRQYSAPQVVRSEAVVAPKPAPSVPSPKAITTSKPSLAYPYIGTELRRIGILAGIILVILIILARVL